MSQDTALFSVRRPRETLGGLNFNSGIPQPTSALKRSSSISGIPQNAPYTASHGRSMSGSRASLAPGRPNQPMFQRSSSGSNLAELGGMSTVKRTSSAQQMFPSTSRKNYASGNLSLGGNLEQSSQQRRSSVYSRPSSMGPMAHQSFFQQGPIPAGVPRDPRPLKDRTYQTKIGQELLDYLTTYGFEMSMKHSLTQNTMKSPTQKDFNYIFQWLYHRIDPSYKFQKNIDQEVPPILKQLRYPFEKSITKSQIAAVGGQNWSTFLGLLHWMMSLAQMLDGYDQGEYESACADAGVDVSGDRIIFNFLSGAYQTWLQVGDDEDEEDANKVLAPHIAAMAAEFDRSNEKYLQELSVLEAEHASLREQIEEVERTTPDVAKLDKHFKILETDKGKFEAYNANMEAKAEKYEARVKFLLEEMEKADAELREAEAEKQSLQESVDRQGITVADIDRLNTERERLQKGVEAASARLEEARRKEAEREVDASRKLDDLERKVERYNSLGYQIGLIPSTAANAGGQDFELVLHLSEGPNFSSSQAATAATTAQFGDSTSALPAPSSSGSDRLLADAHLLTGYTPPSSILNIDLRHTTKPLLLTLRKEINERRGVALESAERNRELLDQLAEAIDDKKAEVEALGHRVRAAEEEFEKTKEVCSSGKMASDAQIERMEKELARMRTGLGESVQLWEQREMNVNFAYEQLRDRANALREELHTEVERILNDVIKFKVHIQERIEDFDGFVVDEVEAELGAEEAEAGNEGGEEEDRDGAEGEGEGN